MRAHERRGLPDAATRLRRLLFAALIASAPIASAGDGDSANGIFLVASPALADPNFRRSVVLVTQMADGGSVGFIVNRPGERSLAQILPDNDVLKRFTEPLYLGGPVQAAGLFAAFRAKQNPPGALRVLADVSLALDPAVVEKLLHAPPGRVRFFNGYAGWAPGQLALELERGGWYALKADADTVFRGNTDTLWEELLARARAVTARLLRRQDADGAGGRSAGTVRAQLSGVSSDTPRRARRVSHRFGR
jgi:putative transcriptional regulator